MYIRRLLLTDFRSCTRVDLHPGRGINILIGSNAQGKSTLLEAIYMLATTRSHRAGRDLELIRWDQDWAMTLADVVREARGEVTVEITLSRTEKRAMRVNQMRHARVPDLVGHLNAVLFSAEDLAIVRGEPSVRRRFLNLEIAQTSPQYCHALVQYRRVLEQRNRLLKVMRDTGRDSDTLDAWNEQLVGAGSQLIERRSTFVAELTRHAAQVHAEITGSGEMLTVVYLPSFPLGGAPSVADAFRSRLEALRREEVARGATLAGPHRDDLAFLINDVDARVFGSQGQQRSIALATKLAELELVRQRVGEAPVLLLDDPAAELDECRRERLFGLVGGGCQTFITCMETDLLPPEILRGACQHRVEGGTVRPMELAGIEHAGIGVASP